MKIILLQDVKKVGQKGSVVEVADGYAQNVLLPRRMALGATAANIKNAEAEAARMVGKKEMDAALAKTVLGKLEGQTVTIHAKAGETGTLFESIHASDIAAAIEKELGFSIPESAIILDESIKKVGEHAVRISLHGASATLTVAVT